MFVLRYIGGSLIALVILAAPRPLAAAPPWNKLVLFKHLEADPKEMYADRPKTTAPG